MNNFEIKHKFPTTKQFVSLFESVGWERDKKRVNQNRKNSCFAVSVFCNGEIVGMGRVVGDSCYFTIYDVVVKQKFQGKGIGSMVLTEIVNWYKSIKDDDTFLYLGASKGKEGFYEKFGFKSRPNADVGAGMKWYDEK